MCIRYEKNKKFVWDGNVKVINRFFLCVKRKVLGYGVFLIIFLEVF